MCRPSVASVELACVDFGMPLDDRHARLGDALPPRLAGALVEAGDDELVLGLIEHRADVAVEADLELRIRRAADRARRADVVAPHHRARVAKARHRHAPLHQLRLGHAPLQRQRLRVIDAARRDAAEPRPVHAGARRRLGGRGCGEASATAAKTNDACSPRRSRTLTTEVTEHTETSFKTPVLLTSMAFRKASPCSQCPPWLTYVDICGTNSPIALRSSAASTPSPIPAVRASSARAACRRPARAAPRPDRSDTDRRPSG